MKPPVPEVWCGEGVFQIQSPICGVYFSKNISIPQARVNKTETELDSIFETSQPLTVRINPPIIV